MTFNCVAQVMVCSIPCRVQHAQQILDVQQNFFQCLILSITKYSVTEPLFKTFRFTD